MAQSVRMAFSNSGSLSQLTNRSPCQLTYVVDAYQQLRKKSKPTQSQRTYGSFSTASHSRLDLSSSFCHLLISMAINLLRSSIYPSSVRLGKLKSQKRLGSKDLSLLRLTDNDKKGKTPYPLSSKRFKFRLCESDK